MSRLLLYDEFGKTLTHALALHRDEWRRGSNLPYRGHSLGVCSLVLEDGGTLQQAIAARVSLAEKPFTARTTLRDLPEVGYGLWSRFTAGRDDQPSYYRALAGTFSRRAPVPVPRGLGEVVASIQRHSVT